MKLSAFAVAAALAVPACGHAAAVPTPAASGTLLSTNLSAAILHLNNMVGVNATGLYGSGMASSAMRPALDPDPNPVSGPSTPCQPSPENGTALLAVLGCAGMLFGRLGYRQMQRSRNAALAA